MKQEIDRFDLYQLVWTGIQTEIPEPTSTATNAHANTSMHWINAFSIWLFIMIIWFE